MIILKELIEAAGDVTVLDVDLRHRDGKLIRQYKIGEGQSEEAATEFMRDKIRRGQLVMIDTKINRYGDTDSHGYSKTVYDPKLDGVPKDLLETEVFSFYQTKLSSYSGHNGSELHVHVHRIQQQITDLLD